MKKIFILVSLFILGTVNVSYAAEKGSKAQITFKNEYIPNDVEPSDDHKDKEEKLPQTNENSNNWVIYGSLIFLGSFWLIRRRSK